MSMQKTIALLSTTAVVSALAGLANAGDPVVFSASGADAVAITPAVELFRVALGDLNSPNPGTVCDGRRQINWDAAPDAISAPNAFPGDFFNFNAFPRARGVEFSTPGTGFQLSATAASGAGVEFDNIIPGLSGLFGTFSPERLFSPLGSTITYVDFFIPGSDVAATSQGFGVVFTDVDVAGSARIELFDIWGASLGVWDAPAAEGDETLSFIGVSFESPIVAGVTIYSGSTPIDTPLQEGEADGDRVAMDDFIFGEPVTPGECSNDCPADLNGDGILDLADVSDFIVAFTSQDVAVDFDSNGILDLRDIQIFAGAYVTGCS